MDSKEKFRQAGLLIGEAALAMATRRVDPAVTGQVRAELAQQSQHDASVQAEHETAGNALADALLQWAQSLHSTATTQPRGAQFVDTQQPVTSSAPKVQMKTPEEPVVFRSSTEQPPPIETFERTKEYYGLDTHPRDKAFEDSLKTRPDTDSPAHKLTRE